MTASAAGDPRARRVLLHRRGELPGRMPRVHARRPGAGRAGARRRAPARARPAALARSPTDEAARVRTADMSQAGRNPGRIIGTVLTRVRARAQPGSRVRIIGEPIWAGRTADEYPACAEHEALINVALGEAPAYILCPYDVAAARASSAHRRHPHPPHPRRRRRPLGEPRLHRPRRAGRLFDQPPEPAPPEADVLVIGPTTGAQHRAAVRARLRAGHGHERRAAAQPAHRRAGTGRSTPSCTRAAPACS